MAVPELRLLPPSGLCFCSQHPCPCHIILLYNLDLSFLLLAYVSPFSVLTLHSKEEPIRFYLEKTHCGRGTGMTSRKTVTFASEKWEKPHLEADGPSSCKECCGGQEHLHGFAFSPWAVVPKYKTSRKVVKSSCIFIKGLKVISFTQGEYHPLSVDLPKNKVKSLLSVIHTPNLGTKFRMTCITYTVFAEYWLLVFSSAIYIFYWGASETGVEGFDPPHPPSYNTQFQLCPCKKGF